VVFAHRFVVFAEGARRSFNCISHLSDLVEVVVAEVVVWRGQCFEVGLVLVKRREHEWAQLCRLLLMQVEKDLDA